MKEQGEYDANTQSWKAKKPKKGECSGNLQSAHDPDATCRVKRDEVYIGYVANIAETCADENGVQLITDYDLEKNNVEDNTMANESIPRMQDTFHAAELYVDGGYSGERVHDTAEANGISMFYTNMTGATPDTIPVTEFTFSENKITHCPEGHASELSVYDEETRTTLAHFDSEICNGCSRKEECPVKPRKQSHSVSITHKQRVAADTRKQINDKDQSRKNTSKRAATEGTISAIKRGHGAGKLAVRCQNKCQVVFGLKVLAHNFKQIVRQKTGDIRRSLLDANRQRKRSQLTAIQSA